MSTLTTSPTCIFCSIINGTIPARELWQNDSFFIMFDIKPLNPDHILVIPREHIDHVYDLSEALYTDLFLTARKAARILKQVTNAPRIGLVVEGFGVPHAHIHLIPIYHAGELDASRAKPADVEVLNKRAKELRPLFEKGMGN